MIMPMKISSSEAYAQYLYKHDEAYRQYADLYKYDNLGIIVSEHDDEEEDAEDALYDFLNPPLFYDGDY